MRVYFVILLIVIAPFISGCSKNDKSDSSSVDTSDKITLEDTDVISYEPAQRASITDPALTSYLDEMQYGGRESTLPTLTDDERSKIGSVAQISKSNKYGLSGVAQIISQDTIALKNFSFNGACLPLLVYLARQNQSGRPLIKIEEVSAPLSNASLGIKIPANTPLTTFDSLGFYCAEDTNKPISTAYFAK